MPTLFKGGRVIVTSVFDPGTLLRDVQERGITSFSAVPTMLQAIVDHPSWDSTDVSSLRHVVYGGSPVLDRVARAWVARGVPVLQGYGMTETSPGVLMAVPDGASARPTSTGVPHFFTDVAVLDERQEVQAANGQTGEMVVRGPNVFSGYWGRPADTQRSFSDDGWFRTGDVVRVEPDGWTYVVDRIKDVIISGGENVYPAEVEAVLATLPGVQACAVVATPDERWGEVGVAFVVLAPEATGSESALTEQLRARLARYKVPRSILFVDEIPTTVTGKIRRNELRERALSL
jgi:fatty-acyl-CoA synthase